MSLRWVWSLLAAVSVIVVGVVMLLSITTVEKRAWIASEDGQSRLLTNLLAGELKMPMMANSRAEVDSLVTAFMYNIPDAQVYLRWAAGDEENYGNMTLPAPIAALKEWPVTAAALAGAEKWHVVAIRYNTARLGYLALYNPGISWDGYADQIRWRLASAAIFVALLVGLLVFVMSARIRDALRLLAHASRRVGNGDFSAHLPIASANEFGKAFHQFNKMVSNLEQREKVQDLYGSYQRPQLVADEYDRNAQRADKQRAVCILDIHVVDFQPGTQCSAQDDALQTLNRHFILFEYIVHAFGGHVGHISGDEMVAVFNHPFDLKCYENQAAKAGIAVVAAAQRLATEDGPEDVIRYSIALATGEVMIGYLGSGRRRQLTIAGAPIALASQLARVVESDDVIAPYGTMLELGHGFRPRELGEYVLPGGKTKRCINVLAGEIYVEQETNEVVEKAFMRFNPLEASDSDQW
ncbi:MAG: HAMP domain-containing protein [Mariprofundus sp.]|nr:HAMP domain-containing protein [Mariprofundus sp.]